MLSLSASSNHWTLRSNLEHWSKHRWCHHSSRLKSRRVDRQSSCLTRRRRWQSEICNSDTFPVSRATCHHMPPKDAKDETSSVMRASRLDNRVPMVCRKAKLLKTAIRTSICTQLLIKVWAHYQMLVRPQPLINRTKRATAKFTLQHPMAWQISPEKVPCQYTSVIQLCTRRTDSLTTPDFQFHQPTLPSTSHISTTTTCIHSNPRIRKLAAECA